MLYIHAKIKSYARIQKRLWTRRKGSTGWLISGQFPYSQLAVIAHTSAIFHTQVYRIQLPRVG